MGNNQEIRKRMETYRSILLVLNWIGAVVLIIVGIVLVNSRYTQGIGIGVIIGSVVIGVIGHFLVNVALAIPFILLNNGDILESMKGNVVKPLTSTKKCPFCAENINNEAKICPHCNKNIEEYELNLKNKEEENSKIKIRELKDKKINIEELLVDDMDNFFLNISKTDNLISYLKFIYENSDHSDDLRIKESNIIKKYGDKLYPIISNWAITVYRGCTIDNIENNKNLILNAIKKDLPYYFNILKNEIK